MFKPIRDLRSFTVFGARPPDADYTVGIVTGFFNVSNSRDEDFYRDYVHSLLHYLEHLYDLRIGIRIYRANQEALPSDLLRDVESINDVDGLVIANQELLKGPYHELVEYLCYPVEPGKDKYLRLVNQASVRLVATVPSWVWWTNSKKNAKDEDGGPNLLGYVFKAIRAAATGKAEGSITYLLQNTRKYPVEPYIVTTLDDFEWLMEELYKAKTISIDTEGSSLNRLTNTLFTLQFCTNYKPDGDTPYIWVLPYEHADTPWSGKDIRYIRAKLRKFFETHQTPHGHVYQNAKYDLTQFINQLGVRWFASRIYDTMAGEFSLDENTKFLSKALAVFGYGPYGLEHIEKRYGFTRPPNLVIDKSQRGNMAEFSIEDIAKYGAYDTLTIYHIARQQCLIAKERGYENWRRLVTEQIGVMITMFAFMEARGVLIDREHLENLASPYGPFAQELEKIEEELYSRPLVKRANRILLKRKRNIDDASGLFPEMGETWVFNIHDTLSLQVLFFDVMGLEPLKERKDKTGSLDKAFQKKYAKDFREVWLYQQFQKFTKLKSAFADSILNTLNNSEDARKDGRIRPSYHFRTVVSGRGSSDEPNFQQVPSRAAEAKIIKRMIQALMGGVFIKSDFSAHEIRVMGIAAEDDVIIQTFETANKALLDLRTAGANYLEEARAVAKKKGDIHILNVKTLFNQDIDKSHPLRSDVKQSIFSTIYGAQEPKIGRDMQEAENEKQYDTIRDARAEIAYLKGDEDKYPEHPSAKFLEFTKTADGWSDKQADQEIELRRKKVAEAKEILEIPVDHYIDRAEDILSKLFTQWDDSAAAIEDSKQEGRANLVVFSPIGRPRHLWSYAFPDKWVHLAMDRRGFNSKIQGLASDIGFNTGWVIREETYKTFWSKGLKFDGQQVLTVHDSFTNEVSLRFAPVMIYLVEHGMTTLVQERYEQVFGFKVRVPFGFDIGVGKNEGSISEWDDKRYESMIDIFKKTAKESKDAAVEKQLDDCLRNWDAIWDVRIRELNDDPYKMLLRGRTKWYAKHIRGMVD